MTPEEARVILEFVMRADPIRGAETRAHVRAQDVLLAIINAPPPAPPPPVPPETPQEKAE